MEQTKKETSRGVKIASGIITLLVVAFVLQLCVRVCTSTNEPTVDMDVNWDTLTTAQREVWLNSYIAAHEYNSQTLATIDRTIKAQFNFPATVKYDRYPSLDKAWITDADSGWVFIRGSGTASNAFNVPEKFNYIIRFVIKPDEQRVDAIEIN